MNLADINGADEADTESPFTLTKADAPLDAHINDWKVPHGVTALATDP